MLFMPVFTISFFMIEMFSELEESPFNMWFFTKSISDGLMAHLSSRKTLTDHE